MVLNTSLKSAATLKSPNLYVKSSKSLNCGRSLQSDITHVLYSVVLCQTIYRILGQISVLSTIMLKTFIYMTICASLHNISHHVRWANSTAVSKQTKSSRYYRSADYFQVGVLMSSFLCFFFTFNAKEGGILTSPAVKV